MVCGKLLDCDWPAAFACAPNPRPGRTATTKPAMTVRQALAAHPYGLNSMVSVPVRCPHLAPEDDVADDRVKQHERKDDHTAPPEHERKAGVRGGRSVNGDDGRNHVRPERQ